MDQPPRPSQSTKHPHERHLHVVEKSVQPVGNPEHVEFVMTPSLAAAAWARGDEMSRLAEELSAADELARFALAPATSAGYQRAWRQFNRYCQSSGVTSLPVAAEVLACYLADAAVCIDESGLPQRDDYKNLVRGRLGPSSLHIHLAAIDRAHEVAGYARPSANPQVRAVVQGIKRTFGTHPERAKLPIELGLLRQLIDVCRRGERRRLRDRCAVLLHHVGVNVPDLARLRTDHVAVREDGDGRPIRCVVQPSGKGSSRYELAAEHPAAQALMLLCNEVRAVADSVPVLQREVDDAALVRLSSGSPSPLSRQSVTQILRRSAEGAGVSVPAKGAPSLRDDEVDAVLAFVDRPALVDLRDRALLLTGWTSALRQSNLRRFRWGDFQDDEDCVEVFVRKDKTDPYGKGRTTWIEAGSNAPTCPLTAWRTWREAVAREIGGDPLGVARDQPCFVPISRHGHLVRLSSGVLAPLGREAVNDIVKGLIERAGVDPSGFGSHSMRVGFITEAAKQGKTVQEIQATTGQKQVQSVLRYTRPIDRRSFSPSRRMGL